MNEDLLIPYDDPTFREATRAAQHLFDESVKMGQSEPGEENAQAAHFAMTAILNVAHIEHDLVPRLLGAIMGTTISALPHPDEALLEALNAAVYFLRQSRQRMADIMADTQGNA